MEEIGLRWKIDVCSSYFDRMLIAGWCFVPDETITRVDVIFTDAFAVPLKSFGLPSPDVAAHVDRHAHHVRFEDWIPFPPQYHGSDFQLRLTLASGRTVITGSGHESSRLGDPYHGCWVHFLVELLKLSHGDVLEIGSRARSGVTRRQFIPPPLGYVGMDLMAGPNVDVVGDAHELSRLFPQRKFAAVFACSVFEHLAMPWKVALEMNRILDIGGLVHIQTHQTWPVHEAPCDYWRFSAFSWECLFNAATGFEVLETVQGEPARVHPLWDSAVLCNMADSPAYLGTAVIARKTTDTALEWPVPCSVAARDAYPAGETHVAPDGHPA